MKNAQKGIATATAIIVGLIILILVVIIVLAARPKSTVAPTNTDTATTTASASGSDTTDTTTASSTTTVTENPNLKTYANPTLGLSFNYPKDFFVKSEGFSATTGNWSATLGADRGQIIVSVVKGAIQNNDVKLQTTSFKIAGKDVIQYNTRRDACDATVATTNLDANYTLQFTFSACGDKLGSIFKDKDDIAALLKSITFTNGGSKLYVNTKTGFAFRYPDSWTQPTQTTTSSLTKITFGNDLEVQAGPQYSSTLKRNLTYTEVVTGALTTQGTTKQDMTISGKQAALLTTTPATGAKKRTVYISNKSSTDLIVITQTGVDADGLNLVLNSFTIIK